MDKTRWDIIKITKEQAKEILQPYHYLSTRSKTFKSGANYGLWDKSESRMAGVIIFTGLPVPEIAVSAFGLPRVGQVGLYELSRLCVHPDYQKGGVHEVPHLTSFFLGKALRQFRRDAQPRAILSYADSSEHVGTIYRATNWKYYGLTLAKQDFWIKQADGTYVKKSRGKTLNLEGEWRPRSQKHRYLQVFDNTLQVLWTEQEWTKQN